MKCNWACTAGIAGKVLLLLEFFADLRIIHVFKVIHSSPQV